MVRTVVVTNMATLAQNIYVNDLPVEQNVLNAYMQSKGDYSWWAYDQRKHPPIEHCGVTVVCGDWSAFVDGHKFQAKSA